MLRVSTKEEGKDSLLESISFLVRAAIHEQVLLSRVTMEIAEEKNVPTLKSFPHHHLNCIIFWIHF